MLEGIFKLQEEMGELNQVLGKIGQAQDFVHWQGDMKQRLIEELSDVYAALNFLVHVNGFDAWEIADRAKLKLDLFYKWHEDGNMRGI